MIRTSVASAIWFCCFFLACSVSGFAKPILNPTLPPNGGPFPDSIAAKMGHCNPITVATVNCATHTIELSAFVSYLFTGLLEPYVATWTTGEVAHKITVTPPGIWSWDPTITGCEPVHYANEYAQPGSFFTGNLSIQGPATICVGESSELLVEAGGYQFNTFTWNPDNGDSTLSPYKITGPGTYDLSVADALGCPFSDQITVNTSSVLIKEAEQFFCPGESITLNGVVYTQSATVLDTIPSTTMGCDTIVTYTLTLLPIQQYSKNLVLCVGDSITIGGQVYTQSGTVIDTLPAGAVGCDTIITYTLNFSTNQTRTENIAFCPGSSVTIGGQVYNQPGIVLDTIAATTGCDTIVTYTLSLLPQPTLEETIGFCPGDIITLGGVDYTQPTTVVLTLPSNSSACDTIATYHLELLSEAASTVNINCPASVTVSVPNISNGAVVNYAPPTASSDCPCPGLTFSLNNGMPPGSNFPQGTTEVCYSATDVCGQSKTCCFNVTVEEAMETSCDTKVNGCITYELLSITEDVADNRTYRIRVTNQCANKMIYAAMGLPSGITAIEPANLSIYTAPSGNTYQVRNASFAPMYSIRFTGIADQINNGESDIFEYTLPAQAQVPFIHVVVRLSPNTFLESYLDTYGCPLGVTPTGNRLTEQLDHGTSKLGLSSQLQLYPNPASQNVRIETGAQSGELLILDATGRVVKQQWVDAPSLELSVNELPQGLYKLVFSGAQSTQYGSLVIQR